MIRRDNIGDLLCTTPLFRALRKHFPLARISVLANSYNAPVLYSNADLDHVLVYEKFKHRRKGQPLWEWLLGRFRVMRTLRNGDYDLVFLPTSSKSANSLKFATLTKARTIIGYDLPQGNERFLSISPIPDDGHEAEIVFHLLSALNICEAPPAMSLTPDPAMCRTIGAGMPQRKNGPWIGLHISARKPMQRWPLERFAELGRSLLAGKAERLLVFWAPGAENDPLHPGDDDKAISLKKLLNDFPVSFVETRQLKELIAGISLCDRMICADGGAMHIAAALQKPLVCLFGNSDASRWYPWAISHCLLQKPSRNVGDILVSEVLDANESLTAMLVRAEES